MVVSRQRARNWAAGVDGDTRGGHRGGLADTPWPPASHHRDVRSSKGQQHATNRHKLVTILF